MQPIKVESRNFGSSQATLQSDDWRVIGYARHGSAPKRRRRKNRSRFVRRLMRRLTLSVFVILSIGCSLIVWRDPASISSMISDGLSKADRFVARAGLGVSQISLDGHRYASDIDIFEVIYGQSGQSLLSIDLQAVRDQLAKLAWVKTADVRREFPDELRVHIVERVPFAVWKVKDKFWLIDKKGQKLAPVAGQSFRELPFVTGKDGNVEIVGFLELLNRFPALSSDVSSIKRVGGRRWTLGFKSGLVAKLPAMSERLALVKLDMLEREKNILTADFNLVDLRIPDRIILRKGKTNKANTLTTSDLSIHGYQHLAPRPSNPAAMPIGSGG